jgi:hypothetical protein
VSKSTLQELRELNVSRQKAAQPPEPSEVVVNPVEPDSPYDNMTGHMTDNTVVQPEMKPTNNKTVRPTGHKYGQSSDQLVVKTSVKQSIKATLQQSGNAQEKPILKTVTIKMDPKLDKRVEDHCHEAGRLKQDVIRDAVLLYFEVVEGNEE